jgi:hypothetical protein
MIRDDEDLITVQELIDAVRKLQQTPDSAKLERIAEARVFDSFLFVENSFSLHDQIRVTRWLC